MLSNHLTSLFATVMFLVLMLLSFAVAAERAGPEQAKTRITEILAHEDFATGYEKTYWREISRKHSRQNVNWDFSMIAKIFGALGNILANISELLLWLVTGIVGFFIARFALKNLGVWRDLWPARVDSYDHLPEAVIENIAHPQLRGDIAGQAEILWQQGQILAALALLYRGSLERMRYRYQIHFNEGGTESDCLAQVRRNVKDPGVREYFAKLTRHWQYAAYAGRVPNAELGADLCGAWRQHFDMSRGDSV